MSTVQSDLHKWETNLKPLASVVDDLISRQAAIEVIYKALKTPAPDYRKDPFHDSMGLAIAMADQIPSAQPEQRWIPCSERLPKKGTRAVLLYSNEKISGGVYMGDRIWNVDYNDTDLSVYIIAWQPRPEPYKADANNL